jgi:hypothetical protein
MIENLQNHFIFKKKLTSFFGRISAIKKGLDTIEGIALLRYSGLKINQSKGDTITHGSMPPSRDHSTIRWKPVETYDSVTKVPTC